MGAAVRPAGGEDAGHAMLFEQREHFVQLEERLRLPIVMQVRVEDFYSVVRERGTVDGGQQARRDERPQASAA
jgi:hypothetical protein